MKLIALLCSLLFCACATTPEAKLRQSYRRVEKTPFEQRYSLYYQLERDGKIDADTRVVWVNAWQHEQRQRVARAKQMQEEHRRRLASLTPTQRHEMEMRERELQNQQALIDLQSQ